MNHLPRELRAVVHIFTYDDELKRKALPHVDQESNCIDWEKIFSQDVGSGHAAALSWAHALWSSCVTEEIFWAAFSMDMELRKRILEAQAILWGISG